MLRHAISKPRNYESPFKILTVQISMPSVSNDLNNGLQCRCRGGYRVPKVYKSDPDSILSHFKTFQEKEKKRKKKGVTSAPSGRAPYPLVRQLLSNPYDSGQRVLETSFQTGVIQQVSDKLLLATSHEGDKNLKFDIPLHISG